MNDDDLRRRLEKLMALRDHPTTLPAIREEATRAEERLRARFHIKDEPPIGYMRRARFEPRADPRLERFLRDMDRETAKVRFPWQGIVGVDR